MKRRTGGTRDWRELLSQTLRRNRLAYGVERARALLVWPEVVGPELARLTRARSVQGGVLFVEAQDAVLANFLTMQRHVFLERLQAKLGDQSVTELRFSMGTFKRATEPRASEPLPPADRARAEQMVRDVPETLRDSALRAAEAVERARLWRERQGWPPCPVCGVPSRHSTCLACQSLLDTPSIQAAARALAREPERYSALLEQVGETGIDAARHLALGTVAEQMEALAVECAGSGGVSEYVEFLRAQAEVWLALYHRKPRASLRRPDWKALPERPRQVLSAGKNPPGTTGDR